MGSFHWNILTLVITAISNGFCMTITLGNRFTLALSIVTATLDHGFSCLSFTAMLCNFRNKLSLSAGEMDNNRYKK